MGFKPKKRYKLVFAEPEWNGLEVVMRRATIGDLLDLQGLGVDPGMSPAAAMGLPEDVIRAIFGTFARFLVSWNVEDDVAGEDGSLATVPVPPTLEGVLTQEQDFIFMILANYQKHILSVAPPLPAGSGNGATPPGPPPAPAGMEIPMTPLTDTPAAPETETTPGSPGSS
jgi:hypothetical protein